MLTNPRIPIVLTIVQLVIALISIGNCQNLEKQREESPKYPVEVGTLELKLIDENQQPVIGAEVYVWTLRCQESPGSTYTWPTENMGLNPHLVTDGEGIVNLRYPIQFGRPPNLLNTLDLQINVEHAMFVRRQLFIVPFGGTATESLKAGCELSISARDESLQPVRDFGILMAGAGRYARWVVDEQNVRRSRAIPDGVSHTMLVSPRQDGRHLFSGILPVKLREGQDVSLRNLPLRVGLRVTGFLSKKVTRPIVDGQIIAWCLPRQAEQETPNMNSILGWQDIVDIKDDGTFEFPSLPRTGKIQLIAICRGWVVKNEEINAADQVTGITIDLESQEDLGDQLSDIEVPMEKTGKLKVLVKKPNGEPLKGAIVSTWPNQSLNFFGSQVLGGAARTRSMQRILWQMDPAQQKNQDNSYVIGRFTQETDGNGIVVLNDIPVGTKQQVMIEHADYQLPQEVGKNNRFLDYVCADTEITELSVIVEESK